MDTNRRTDESPYLTVADLAARWHTTPNAIYTARHKRRAPRGFRRGQKVLFPLDAVETFEREAMETDRSNPANDPAREPVERKQVRRTRARATA